MDEDIIEYAEAYVALRNCSLARRLGSGIHGIVYEIESNAQPNVSALKIHYGEGPYRREKEVYERLKETDVFEIRGFEVPRLVAFDDDLLAIEITVVMPPWVLDFAGAYLDFAPEFTEEIWEEWERKNQEQFGADWPMAEIILGDLQDIGIHMHDPSPSNIRFR